MVYRLNCSTKINEDGAIIRFIKFVATNIFPSKMIAILQGLLYNTRIISFSKLKFKKLKKLTLTNVIDKIIFKISAQKIICFILGELNLFNCKLMNAKLIVTIIFTIGMILINSLLPGFRSSHLKEFTLLTYNVIYCY